MRLKKRKGQAFVEYAVITATVILALLSATKGLALLMKGQVEGTSKGLSSGKHLKK